MNSELASHRFLEPMYQDGYFPKVCVDAVRQVLVEVCDAIERERPSNLSGLYRISHAATERINALQALFLEHGSEIETAARELIADEFGRIARAYGFDADVEELIAPRDW